MPLAAARNLATICLLCAGFTAASWTASAKSSDSRDRYGFDERCQPAGMRLVAANRYARVYYGTRESELAYCLPGGREAKMALLADEAYPPPAISLVGPYLAYAGQANDGQQNVDNVIVVDVRANELLFTADYVGGVGSLKVNRRGSVAWIVCPFGQLLEGKLQCTQSGTPETGRVARSVYRHDSRSTKQEPIQLVARSRRIEVQSLRREGHRIYWKQGGKTRRASLR